MSSENKIVLNMQLIDTQKPSTTVEGEAQLYPVNHASARRWVDMNLHLGDLNTVLGWIDALIHRHTQPTQEAHALWIASLITFFKCFKRSASRAKLDASVVFANEPSEGRAQFLILQSLRDKAVVHDENPYTQGAVLVPIANPGGPVARRGEAIVLCFLASTLDDGHISNLRLLTLAAIAYTERAVSLASEEVAEYLRTASRAELIASGPYTYTSPSPEVADQNRPKILE